MEKVETKLEVNVAKSVDTTFSQETGDRFVSPAPLFKDTSHLRGCPFEKKLYVRKL